MLRTKELKKLASVVYMCGVFQLNEKNKDEPNLADICLKSNKSG